MMKVLIKHKVKKMKLKLFRKSYKYIKQIENKMLTSTMVDVNMFHSIYIYIRVETK